MDYSSCMRGLWAEKDISVLRFNFSKIIKTGSVNMRTMKDPKTVMMSFFFQGAISTLFSQNWMLSINAPCRPVKLKISIFSKPCLFRNAVMVSGLKVR